MPNVLRRVPSDKPWATDVNYLIDFVTGNRVGGQLNIEDDTGQELDVDGEELSAANCAVHIASGIGKALCVDDGALFSGPVDMDGPVDVDGTLNVDGTAHFTNTLTVDGASTFKAPLTVNHSGTGVPQLTVTNAGVTALLVDGTVFTADLAPLAVTEARIASAGGGTTTTGTSYGTLADMDTGLFTTYGGPLLVILVCVVQHGTANVRIDMALALDGAAAVGDVHVQPPALGQSVVLATTYLFTGVPAGSHQIRGRWSTASGTAYGVTNQRRLVCVEFKK